MDCGGELESRRVRTSHPHFLEKGVTVTHQYWGPTYTNEKLELVEPFTAPDDGAYVFVQAEGGYRMVLFNQDVHEGVYHCGYVTP